MSYSTDLKSGTWQRKRLEIMQRDSYCCVACHGQDALTVHHLYYEPNKKPWEYDNEAMVTLCEKCHNSLHFELSKLAGIIAFNLLIGKVDLTQFNLYGHGL